MAEPFIPLDAESGGDFDLLIIGGGINGTGLARDAAGRGLRVLLLEQADLAAHTSSASTKLIHGGLRYLEYGEFRLVREALRERERLLALAPHLIRPLRFVIPHSADIRPRWMIRLGLFVYDRLGGSRLLPGSEAVDLKTSPVGEALEPSFEHGFSYWDCAVDDSRLVVSNAVDAARRGAHIRTRCRLVAARRDRGRWRAVYRDLRTENRIAVRTRAIVNAAGPWVEALDRAAFRRNPAIRMRLVKGSHIVVPRCQGVEHAFLFQHADRRVLFAIPYEQKFTLIGTTDCPFEGNAGEATATPEEVEYLCAGVNRYLRHKISPKDVLWSFAGVRPLVDDERREAAAVTREYRLEVDGGDERAVLLSVYGGKITTYRRLAEHALEKLRPFLGFSAPPWTGGVPLPGGDIPSGDFPEYRAGVRRRWPALPSSLLDRLARSYGTRLEKILGTAQSLEDLGGDLGGGLSPAEIDFLVEQEWAETSEDILWRRSKLGLHAPADTAVRIQSYLETRGKEFPHIPQAPRELAT